MLALLAVRQHRFDVFNCTKRDSYRQCFNRTLKPTEERNIMNNLAYSYEPQYIEEWHNCYVSPTKNHGMVAALDLHKEPQTFWYSLDTLNKLEAITHRNEPYSNIYLSLNAFKQINGAVKRKASYLAQIRNIGIDLDCYKIGIAPADCKTQLIALIEKGKIPNPNLLINSGNGVQLIYSIEGGAAPTEEIKWLVMYITRELTGQLTQLGADYQCCTLERVFRLPNTLNKKINKPTKLVTTEIWNKQEWTLNELMEYVKPYKPATKRSKLRAVIPLRGYKKGLRTLPQFNMARANDLLNLVQLRKGHIENRNILCYDYAFALALGSDMSRSEIHTAVLQLDSSFTSQQKRNVLKSTVKSACDGAEKFWKSYEKNAYSMNGLEKTLVKPKRTTTIINDHSITDIEQQELEVLIGKEEKQRRKYEKRYENGMKKREDYLKECAEKTDNKLERLRELKQANPKATVQELADMMNVSKSSVQRMNRKLKS